MSESNPDLAELRADVAALSAVVAALFACQMNLNHMGHAKPLASAAETIAKAGHAHPERIAALVHGITRQACAAAEALKV